MGAPGYELPSRWVSHREGDAIEKAIISNREGDHQGRRMHRAIRGTVPMKTSPRGAESPTRSMLVYSLAILMVPLVIGHKLQAKQHKMHRSNKIHVAYRQVLIKQM